MQDRSSFARMRPPMLAALFLLSCLPSDAAAQTASSCIAFSNSWVTPSKDKVVSIEVDGYPNASWTAQFGDRIGTLVTSDGTIVRGASFTVRVYEGRGGASGGGTLLDSSVSGQKTNHMLWIFALAGQSVADSRPECASAGIWLLYVN